MNDWVPLASGCSAAADVRLPPPMPNSPEQPEAR